MKKVVLAYSGGLDTSVAIKWLQHRHGYEVVALAVDVGAAKDLDVIQDKALQIGAIQSRMVDARADLAEKYILPALKANAMYEGKYSLASALSRPLISKLLVDVAEEVGAEAVAHGCTGKGNDQVRFDTSIAALNPNLKIIAPVREWPMSREDEIAYAQQHGIPIPVGKENPFSIDENLWGRSIECGVLEDPWAEAPEEAFEWTTSPQDAPEQPEYLEIGFVRGAPTHLNGQRMNLTELLETLNEIAGRHGVGRIDHVENRLVGIKSREIYEAPAATVLINSHRELESFTLPRELGHFKASLEPQYAELTYSGLWHSPLREALDAFMDSSQKSVTGLIRVKLFRGSCQVVGRQSDYSMYDLSLATYGDDDAFDHQAAEGFINYWRLPTVVYSEKQRTAAKLKSEESRLVVD